MVVRAVRLFCALFAVCIPLEGCHAKTQPPATPKVALVATADGFGDRAYNDSALAGLTACKRQTGVTVATVAPASAAEYEPKLALLATQNYDAVIGLGRAMAPDIARVARRFGGTHFAAIDARVEEPNVDSITFKEQEGAFLAGALAAMVSRTKSVAFLGGTDAPIVQRFETGFIAGVRQIDPRIHVAVRYVGSFTDGAAAHQQADALFNRGADIIFTVAGRAGLGAVAAVKARPADFLIGVDTDEDALAPGKILTSVVKRIDRATLRVCNEAVAQKPMSGSVGLGLAEGGISLTSFDYTKRIVGAARIARVDRIRAAIVSGALRPPASRAELDRFRPVAIP